MHEKNSPNEPNSFFCCSNSMFSLSVSPLWGGAIVPFTNSEFDSALLISFNSSWGPKIWLFRWPFLFPLATLLSTARNWPRDGGLFFWLWATSGSILLEHRQSKHELNLNLLWSFLLSNTSVFVPLIDLLDSSTMLLTPIKLPSVVLLSRKNDPVDWIKRYMTKISNIVSCISDYWIIIFISLGLFLYHIGRCKTCSKTFHSNQHW